MSLFALRRHFDTLIRRVVEYYHPKAAMPLSKLFLESMSVPEFAKLPDPTDFFLYINQEHLSQETYEFIVNKIDVAHQDYAHYLAINQLDDIKVTWSVELTLVPQPGDNRAWLHGYAGKVSPEEFQVMQYAWANRYASVPYDPQTGRAGFSIVCNQDLLAWFRTECPHWDVYFEANIEPERKITTAPPTPTLTPEQRHAELLRGQKELLHKRIKNTTKIWEHPRGDDPWYPFPSHGCTRRTTNCKSAPQIIAPIKLAGGDFIPVKPRPIDAEVAQICASWSTPTETKALAEQALKELEKALQFGCGAPAAGPPRPRAIAPKVASWSTVCSGESLASKPAE